MAPSCTPDSDSQVARGERTKRLATPLATLPVTALALLSLWCGAIAFGSATLSSEAPGPYEVEATAQVPPAGDAPSDPAREAELPPLARAIDDYFSALRNATYCETTSERLTLSATVHPDARTSTLLVQIRRLVIAGRSEDDIVGTLAGTRDDWNRYRGHAMVEVEVRHSEADATNTTDIFRSPLPKYIRLTCGGRPVRWLLDGEPSGLRYENVRVANFIGKGGRPSIGPLKPTGPRAIFRGRVGSWTAIVGDEFIEFGRKKSPVQYSLSIDDFDQFRGRYRSTQPLDLNDDSNKLLRQREISITGDLPREWPFVPEEAAAIIARVTK